MSQTQARVMNKSSLLALLLAGTPKKIDHMINKGGFPKKNYPFKKNKKYIYNVHVHVN